jgi:hypothetical protein
VLWLAIGGGGCIGGFNRCATCAASIASTH